MQFGLQWENQRSSYQVREILEFFLEIICSSFTLNLFQKPYTSKDFQRNQT